ncbi:MAG: hypothetical protein AUG49_20505 [Catenulispora sp. 13_1_20CM_3_70_7]|nr:hypothetical protein [Catenulisporales bacterium]OLE21988.1 MAG: hypothetical protein AUG49_20505 [Catenulispora sp. 13_1_20CM_3_70_7]
MTTRSIETSTDTSAETVSEIVPELVEEDAVLEAAGDTDVLDDAAAAQEALPDADVYEAELDTGTGSGSAVAAGAAAIAAAGLGAISLSGSWLGDMLAQRQTLIAQIATANSNADVIIKQRYTNPWHKTAFVSLGFAVAAIVIAGATLFLGTFAARQQSPVWVRAVSWGALALGVIGLGVAAAMYFDVFAGTISVPAGAANGGGN